MQAEPRLKAGIFVRATLRRAEAAGASAFILSKGAEEAGAVIIRVARLDGTSLVLSQARAGDGALVWQQPLGGAVPDARASEWCAKQLSFDPDLWVLEIEDRQGRAFVDDPIL
jgi:hypothetical protein